MQKGYPVWRVALWYCRALFPSAGITRIRFSGSMWVITLYDQSHPLSLDPQAPYHYKVVNVNSV